MPQRPMFASPTDTPNAAPSTVQPAGLFSGGALGTGMSDDVADSLATTGGTATTPAVPASIERVTLSSGGPPIVPSAWPMILGGVLIGLAILCTLAWFIWQRADALRAAGLLLRARFLRTPTEWRAVSAIAREAKLPVATVLLSRSAFARGAKVIVESKDPPFAPIIVQRIDQRVFG
ncbi:MAG: hypothetical protein MUE97_07870 [Phycisphaerales bacterium]|nr:hypothetical protein [Phycisphaerales bacterium]